MNDRFMIVNIYFIGEKDSMTFRENEYNRGHLEELVKWFKEGIEETFIVNFNDSSFTYLSRKAIKYIIVNLPKQKR